MGFKQRPSTLEPEDLCLKLLEFDDGLKCLKYSPSVGALGG